MNSRPSRRYTGRVTGRRVFVRNGTKVFIEDLEISGEVRFGLFV